MQTKLLITLLVLGLLMTSRLDATQVKTNIKKQSFGKTADGIPVDLYILTNSTGAETAITNYGGIVVWLKVSDRKGIPGDVVLGYDSLDGYLSDKAYLGALIGRYGNRIAHGKFTLNGVTYTLPQNNGENMLHGGIQGFNRKVWQAEEIPSPNGPGLRLHYLSKDGEEGFPGNLSVQVVYTWTNQNELKIEYSATTDKDTVLNLTQHSYFNLAGAGSGDVLQHELTLHSDKFTLVDSKLIPTGEIRSVQGTPFDFRTPVAIGARIEDNDQQLRYGPGYDHNWVLESGNSDHPALAAEVYEPHSGRTLEVWTTQPAIQFYSGNSLDGIHGKGGKIYNRRDALCLETQHYPDSPNHPNFPSTELKPGEHFHSITIYKFGAR
ncbi:MAG: aldose epimerase family protein [Terriglobales bacterium]